MIILPLSVQYSKKKKFILNLNQYSSSHFRTVIKAKSDYCALIWDSLPDVEYREPVRLVYRYFAKTRRVIDVSNPCSVIDKFACDALVKKKILLDDNHIHVPEVHYIWGGVDKDNPRCELEIEVI